MKTQSTNSRAFTLIELLVVIAIIAILAAILFPVFAQAKAAAKRTTDLSNNKQISLGVLMYMNDVDDMTPIFRTVINGGDWWTAKMMSWKDSTGGYIKNGGRPYNNGVPYTVPDNGGIFQSSIHDAPWSDVTPIYWGWPLAEGPGDETTRFPRGYSLNQDAGRNEGGAPVNGAVAKGIIADWEVNTLQSAVGSETQLTNGAGTIMIANQRVFFTGAWVAEMGYTCDANGLPGGGSQLSCIQSTHNRGMNVAFFDGHAKNVKGQETVGKSDMWDALAAYELASPGYWQGVINATNAIPEWTK